MNQNPRQIEFVIAVGITSALWALFIHRWDPVVSCFGPIALVLGLWRPMRRMAMTRTIAWVLALTLAGSWAAITMRLQR